MRIETERLVLREYRQDDWPLVHAYQSEPRYLRLYPAEHGTVASSQKMVDLFVEWQLDLPRIKYQFAVCLPTGELIGSCGLRRSHPRSYDADIGYELSPLHWGCGYATEAAQAMLVFGFDHLGLQRVWAACLTVNTPSARVLTRIGMNFEVRLTRNRFFNNRWWDVDQFGYQREDWAGSEGSRYHLIDVEYPEPADHS